ncbi:septum site-determining protein MinC [Paracoccus sp. 1_MG-2023]|uniref:septum site-determining protein MinC n=1 Tax=unclassified Paracoccus (in: a-proteobacteria) TaxID=2688777 RepID=UPI001C0938E7|nr:MULTISPECIES: septum site-determining protein MinC [unclassified Paracoccus (in: a-proteobacteria)]MBU2957871.1 septum site-determining protein MinC [Paracoccus sp. C2R09]MDO6668937.1 septum site-determining protein MinC [Paracoccus sp. 1_MG-2023]
MSDRTVRTRNDQGPASVGAFQVRGRFLTALALRIESSIADEGFYAQLDEQLNRTPQFFAGAPMVLNLSHAPGFREADALGALVGNLRQRDFRVFGVENAADMDEALLGSLGLIPVETGRDAPLPREPRPGRPAPAAAQPAPQAEAPAPLRNKVIHSPVRSGQMIVAEQGDLTVIGSVASGAELVAAGNIHVYGPLRGRAMAGCHGDETAHIFCQSLNAELVAIAGLYKTNELLEDAARQRCTHIYLEDEKLRMEVIA